MNIYSRKNSLFDTYRTEKLNDIEYIVVNGVPLKETVLNGRFVSADEIGAFVKDWDGVPVVICHPKTNGGSARVPASDVPVVGRFYNSKMDGTRLVGEFWLEKNKLDELEDGRVLLQAIQSNRPVEVSTGYSSETIEFAGHYNNVPYNFVDRNLRPDHIALLSDDVGACSIVDGCGLNRNENCEGSQLNELTTEYAPMTASALRDDLLAGFEVARDDKPIKFDGFVRTFSDVGMTVAGVVYWPEPEVTFRIEIKKVSVKGRITESSVEWGLYELLRGSAWSLNYESAELESVGDSGFTISFAEGSRFVVVVVEHDVIDYDVRVEDFPTARDDVSLHLKDIPQDTLVEFVEYFASVE